GLTGEGYTGLGGGAQVPVGGLRPLGWAKPAGRKFEETTVRLVGPDAFEGIDLAFFAAGPTVAGAHAADAVRAGAHAIDLSSRFRLDESVPLVVPEVNAGLLSSPAPPDLIASPRSPAGGLAVVLAPLAEA